MNNCFYFRMHYLYPVEGIDSDMLNKELSKLSRRELMDIIYQMKKNEQQMQEELASLRESLEEKRIRLSEAGSVAEAAVSVSNVFSSAQMSADLYLQEVARMREDTEKECERMVAEAEQTVAKTLAEGEKQYAALRVCYRTLYQKWQQLLDAVQKTEESIKRT